MNAWTALVVAGVVEVVWAPSMKAAQGFTKYHYTALTFAAAWASF
ncbi:MAG: SMR family transporter, partial [Betaproteobacteria bacterium]